MMAKSKKVKVEIMSEAEKKEVRQAKFIESCKGLSAEEIVERAKLFQGIDVSRFKVVKMVG